MGKEIAGKHFSDIVDCIPPEKNWRTHIAADTPIVVVEYSHGDVIVDSTAPGTNSRLNNHMAIVISGMAELTEEYSLTAHENSAGVTCYRPIRLLEKGDMFNDFSIVDRHAFETVPAARPGEVWTLRSGRRSCQVIPHKSISSFVQFRDDEGIHAGHNFLQRSFNEPCQVAYVYVNEGSSDFHKLLHDLMKNSWRRAYTYRACLNSYNVGEKLDFRYKALKSIGALNKVRGILNQAGADKEKKYSDKVNRTGIMEPLLDAVFDAINRPSRDEPLFAEIPSYAHSLGKILVSARPSKNPSTDTFYFPIGRGNYLMAKHAISSGRGRDFLEGLSISAPRAPRLNPIGTYGEYKEEPFKGNGMHFWYTVADEILKAYADIAAERLPGWKLSVEPLQVSDNAHELFMVYRR
jgi:hypothetical protein